MKYTFLIILFYFSAYYAQTNKSIAADTLKKFNNKDTLQQLILNKGNDTLPRKSFLELKTLLLKDFSKLDQLKIILKNEDEYEYFTKEELASGLNRKQLSAYKKNKETLYNILQKKYDDCWWYKVKSLGELIGIPDLVIKMLQFGLLLL